MTTLLAFVFVLGVLVFVHELGHFATAKWIGVRVEVFSLGFPPKLVGRRWGETEYRVGIVPLGGYVKMAGDNPAESTGNPDEFFSRSKWERLAILFAGPFMNFVLAVVFFAALFMAGIERPAWLAEPAVIGFVAEDSPGERAGIRPGDRIVAIEGEPVDTWRQVLEASAIGQETWNLTVERDGRRLKRSIEMEAAEESVGFGGVAPVLRPQVRRVLPDSPAARAGLREGDLITAVDGEPIAHFAQFTGAIEARDGRSVALEILRDGERLEIDVTPVQQDDRFVIGIEFHVPTVLHRIANPFAAFGAALEETARRTGAILGAVGGILTGRISARSVSGPIGIAALSGETARRGLRSLMDFMALLSLNLGILNLLPIPLLDGGHIAMLAAEGLAGRDFSPEVKERIMQIGLVLLLLFLAMVIYFDLMRL